jgi:15-cis-phytoene synthase
MGEEQCRKRRFHNAAGCVRGLGSFNVGQGLILVKEQDLVPTDDLDPRHRIALAYAPMSARGAWLALLQFESKLADVARPGRDPMMVQLRLAWWRDRLAEAQERWPVSEPVLALLKAWEGKHQNLLPLVDGWEARIVGEDDGRELAEGRVAAYSALADLVGVTSLDAVQAAVRHIDNPNSSAPLPSRIPRAMRPLAILRAFALRDANGGKATPLVDLARIMRAGLFGR